MLGWGEESLVPRDSRQSMLWYIGHQLHVLSYAMAVGTFLMPSDKCTSSSRDLGLRLPTNYEKRAGRVGFCYAFE